MMLSALSTNVEREGVVLLTMGNPLLDIMVKVPNNDLHQKYRLKEDDAILASSEHLPLFDELITSLDGVHYAPGGATQNTTRIFQWMVKKPNQTVFFGAIGADKTGQILDEIMKRQGVLTRYQVNSAEKTGKCAVLLYNNQRSLCTILGASSTFSIHHLTTVKNWTLVEAAKFYYISGYFITSCHEAIMAVGKHAADTNKCFMMNLSAPFICQLFFKQMFEALPYVDVLFSNDTEAMAFAEKLNLGDGANKPIEEIALLIAGQEKVNNTRPRMVVITCGSDPLVIACGGKTKHFDVPSVEQIVDTNGAGDAFCGGFIAALVYGKPMEECVRAGCWAAAIIIQNEGCTLPDDECTYQFS